MNMNRTILLSFLIVIAIGIAFSISVTGPTFNYSEYFVDKESHSAFFKYGQPYNKFMGIKILQNGSYFGKIEPDIRCTMPFIPDKVINGYAVKYISTTTSKYFEVFDMVNCSMIGNIYIDYTVNDWALAWIDNKPLLFTMSQDLILRSYKLNDLSLYSSSSYSIFNYYFDSSYTHKIEYKVYNNTGYMKIDINTKYLIDKGYLRSDGSDLLIVDDSNKKILSYYVVKGTWYTDDTQIIVKLNSNTTTVGVYFDFNSIEYNFDGTFDGFGTTAMNSKIEGIVSDKYLHVYGNISNFKNYTVVTFYVNNTFNNSVLIFDVPSTNPLYNYITCNSKMYLDFDRIYNMSYSGKLYFKDLYYFYINYGTTDRKVTVILPNNLDIGYHKLYIFYNNTGYVNYKCNDINNKDIHSLIDSHRISMSSIGYNSYTQTFDTYNYSLSKYYIFIYNGGYIYEHNVYANSGYYARSDTPSNIGLRVVQYNTLSGQNIAVRLIYGTSLYTLFSSVGSLISVSSYEIIAHGTSVDIYYNGNGGGYYHVDATTPITQLTFSYHTESSGVDATSTLEGDMYNLVTDYIYDGILSTNSYVNKFNSIIIYRENVNASTYEYNDMSLIIQNNTNNFHNYTVVLYDNYGNKMYKTFNSTGYNDINLSSMNGNISYIRGMYIIVYSDDVNINNIVLHGSPISYYRELNNGLGISMYKYLGSTYVGYEVINNLYLSWNETIDGYNNTEFKFYFYPFNGTGNYTINVTHESGDYVTINGNITNNITIQSTDYRLKYIDISYYDNNSDGYGEIKVDVYKDGSYIGTLNYNYTIPYSSNYTYKSNIDLDFSFGRFDDKGIDEIVYVSNPNIYVFDATTSKLLYVYDVYKSLGNVYSSNQITDMGVVANDYNNIYMYIITKKIPTPISIYSFYFGRGGIGKTLLVSGNPADYGLSSSSAVGTKDVCYIIYSFGNYVPYCLYIPTKSIVIGYSDADLGNYETVSDYCGIKVVSSGYTRYICGNSYGTNSLDKSLTHNVMVDYSNNKWYSTGKIDASIPDYGTAYSDTLIDILNGIYTKFDNHANSLPNNLFIGRFSGNNTYIYVTDGSGNTRVFNGNNELLKNYGTSLINIAKCNWIIDADMDGYLDCIKGNKIYSQKNANGMISNIQYVQQYSINVGDYVPFRVDVLYDNPHVSPFNSSDSWYSTIYLPDFANGTSVFIIKQGTIQEPYEYAKIVNDTLFFLPTIPSLSTQSYQINYYAKPVEMVKSELINNHSYLLYMNFTGPTILNYFGIIAYVPVPESIYYPHLYYYENGSWVDVTYNPSYNFQTIDDNNNGLIDHIKFILPTVRSNTTERYMISAIYSEPVICNVTDKKLVNAPITASQYAYWNWTVVCYNPNNFAVNFDSKVKLPLESSEILLDGNLVEPDVLPDGYYVHIKGSINANSNQTHYITFKTPPVTIIPTYYYPNKYYVGELADVQLKLDVRNWANEPLPNLHVTIPLIYGEDIKVIDENGTTISQISEVSGMLDFVIPIIQSQEAQTYTVYYKIPVGEAKYPYKPTTTIINGTQYVVKYVEIDSKTPIPLKDNVYYVDDVPCDNVTKVIQVNSFSSDFGDKLEYSCNGSKTVIFLGSLDVGQKKYIKIYYKGKLPVEKIQPIENATNSIKNAINNAMNYYESFWKNIFENYLHVQYDTTAKIISYIIPLALLGLIIKIFLLVPK